MLPRPPTPTLFPYTTLFRSDHHDDIAKGLEQHLPPLDAALATLIEDLEDRGMLPDVVVYCAGEFGRTPLIRSEEHTSELQSRRDLVCRLLLEKKKTNKVVAL